MQTTLPPSPPRAYRIERFIGRGGFGHVYLASPLSQGTLGRVALKVMDEGAAEEWVARFFHEAQILSSLSGYPNFIHVNAVFRMERRFCIDMEYVSGLTLDTLLARAGALPVPVALTIVRQVALALDAACNRARDDRGELLRVLHRDMKPGNLRLGAGGVVKILDFGLARSELRGVRPETLKVLPATLAYMAPERFGFRSDFGAPADIYALGLTLFEMLAGKPFFHDPQVSSFMLADHEELEHLTHKRIDELQASVGHEVRVLLARMLSIPVGRRVSAAETEFCCREILGVHGEDVYRDWVESVLEPLQREGQSEPGSDPWRWVGTVRRSDAERDPAIDALAGHRDPAISTFPRTDPGSTAVVNVTDDEPAIVAPRRRWVMPIAALLGLVAALALILATRGEQRAWYRDGDGDGYGLGPAELSRAATVVGSALQSGDCDETRVDVHPSAIEVCDGVDQDCDGELDEGLPQTTWYRDGDSDGLGADEVRSCSATPPQGAVAAKGDCDDTNPALGTNCRAGRGSSSPGPVRPTSGSTPAVSEPVVVVAAEEAPVPQGHVTMKGTEATLVTLRGPASLSLRPGQELTAAAGSYKATVEYQGGNYREDVVIPVGGLLTFDCTTLKMGRPCQVR